MTKSLTITTHSTRARVFRAALPVLLLLLSALMALSPRQALAQTKSFHMDQYNADITVNTDGSYDIVETLVYVYDEGSFHRGTRTWDMSKLDNINNVQVVEVLPGGQTQSYNATTYDPDNSTYGVPGTFGTLQEGNTFNARWVYDYVANTTKTFKVSYHVTGAMRVYDTFDRFDWYAVPPAWAGPINASRVQITFPSGVDTSKLAVKSNPQAETSTQPNSVTLTANGSLSNGFEIIADVPITPGAPVLQVQKPAWQAAVDQQEAQQAQYNKIRPLVDFGFLLLSVLILVGGLLWVIMRWYRRGRDKAVKTFAEYLTDPPSNLPPGLVGTLLDESADVRDVIATIVDQGRKGNLVMREVDKGGLFSSKDFEYQLLANKVDYPYEDMVLRSIFKHGNPVRLSDLKNTFYQDLQPIYSEMYSTVVRLGLFPESPQSVRMRNVAGGIGILVLAGLAAGAAFVFGETVSYLIFALPVALFIVGLAWLVTAGAMPRKTDQGSEEASKWQAFGRYLRNMQQYTNVQSAADKFQQYLPYAVAMDIEKDLINQFSRVPAAMPPYYVPYGYGPVFYPFPVGVPGHQGVGPEGAAGAPGMGGGMPSFNPAGGMQGMSDSLAGAMQGMSDSFTQMVNSASSVLTSQPQSSGGGGGGGFGGGGFGGGGGGGGGGAD